MKIISVLIFGLLPKQLFHFYRIGLALLILLSLFPNTEALAQATDRPEISCVTTSEGLRLDGSLDEAAWANAATINEFRMIVPEQNGTPSFPMRVKILADKKNLYFGIICFDDEPEKIVAFSKVRDSELEYEDNIKIILDTYGDGRSGYIFAINPFAARYDALVARNGESENPNWDGAWDARTRRNTDSWSAEIRIPVSTLTFKKGLDSWGFNVERRIQRLIEVNRWTAISRDYKIGQTIHAGKLIALPQFNLGIGMTPKASLVGKASNEAGEKTNYDWQPSLDITQRISSDINAQITVNTDFAETEVDSRQTNLTRFPLLFPEKRQFFLEGADIYEFGLQMGDIFSRPFYSRSIGLYEGQEVPIVAGGKINGKINNTHFGALVNHTAEVDTLVPSSTVGVVRLKQNIFKESSIGLISTIGDPAGRGQAWTTGVDFTYQNSTFRGSKNLLVGVWGQMNGREDLTGDRAAWGFKIDYPNDLWDWFLGYQRTGAFFDPSLGFVSRMDSKIYLFKLNYMPRPENPFIRQHSFMFLPAYYTDMANNWESYNIKITPFNPSFESGDNIGFTLLPSGEYLKKPFKISNGVVLQPGGYHFMRYILEAQTASKRSVNGMATWQFGGFYGGELDQIQLLLNWRLMSFLILEFSYENNIARLPEGSFNKDLLALRTQFNFSSNLNFSTFLQYDNDSQSVGSYSRFRWTFAALGDLFIVYKHNLKQAVPDRWNYDSNQLIVKLTYGIAL